MMDQERFEELLLAEIDGRLTLDQRAQLDAACEHDSGLARLRKNDLRVARMMRSLPPARVPASLAADVMHRFELELSGESESEQFEEVHPARRASRERSEYEPQPVDEDPFETTSSGSRYREVYEPYREQVAVRSTAPWWSAILGSTFLRLSFGMSVMILCIYMGSVIMKQSRGDAIPGLRSPSDFAQGIPEDSGGEDGKVVALATAEPVPHVTEARIAPLENPNPTAIDLNALVELTPIPADAQLPEDALAEAKSEAESVGQMDPAIEKMLASAEGADAKAEAAAAAAIAAIPDTAAQPMTQPTTTTQPAPAAAPSPVTIASAKPQVDLPEGIAETTTPPTIDEKTIASADTKPQAGAGMEQVFERIKTDLDTKKSEPAASTPPGAREVKDTQELRSALAEREVASRPAETAAANPPAVSTAAPTSQPSAEPTRVMTEVDELRRALSGQSQTTTAKKPEPTRTVVSSPAVTKSAAETGAMSQAAPAPATPPKDAAVASAPASEKVQNGFATPSAAPKLSPEDRLRKIEMAIVRNGGTILGRRPDDKDPTTTRVKVLMTRAQIRTLEHDLAKQGLAPAKKREDSAADSGVGDKPIEFEILVKSK